MFQRKDEARATEDDEGLNVGNYSVGDAGGCERSEYRIWVIQ